ncbi:MAG: hypothetical protein ACT4N2_09775 [Hyphomicrobium sp.]
MSMRRVIGLGFFALALLILGYDLVTGLSGAGTLGFAFLGEQWGRISAASLNLVQAIVQPYLFPALWDPILVTLLLLPAWVVFGVPGLLFYLYPANSLKIATLTGARVKRLHS